MIEAPEAITCQCSAQLKSKSAPGAVRTDSHICADKERFLRAMEVAIPWSALVEIVLPRFDSARLTRSPGTIETLLRQHLLQQWLSMADAAVEDEFLAIPQYRDFIRFAPDTPHLSRPAYVRGFRLLLKQYGLEGQVLRVVNAALESRGLSMWPAACT